MAERSVREIKLRTALLLHMKNQSFKMWKQYLPQVLNSINNHNTRGQYKSSIDMLKAFNTSPTTFIPQTNDNLYRFKIGDAVIINALPKTRKQLNFKYSLNRGRI
jgi:hypothetical protein